MTRVGIAALAVAAVAAGVLLWNRPTPAPDPAPPPAGESAAAAAPAPRSLRLEGGPDRPARPAPRAPRPPARVAADEGFGYRGPTRPEAARAFSALGPGHQPEAYAAALVGLDEELEAAGISGVRVDELDCSTAPCVLWTDVPEDPALEFALLKVLWARLELRPVGALRRPGAGGAVLQGYHFETEPLPDGGLTLQDLSRSLAARHEASP